LSSTETEKVKPWGYLTIATTAQASTSFVSLGVASLIPFLMHPLQMTAADAGLAGGAVNTGMMALALPAGYLTDRYGEKPVMVAGCVLTGLTVMTAAWMRAFPALYTVLLFTGFWAGSVTPAGSKLVMNWFGSQKLGFAQSVRQTGVTLGGLLAALVLPVLALGTNWHTAFLVSGFPGVLAGGLVALAYRAPRGARTDSLRRPPAAGWRVVLQTLSDRDVWLTCSVGTVFVGGQFVLLSYLQLFLHSRLLWPAQTTGHFLALTILAGTIGRIFWGTFSDRTLGGRRQPALVVAGLLTAVSSLAMLLVGAATPLPAVAALTFVLGFAGLGWNGVYITLLSELGATRGKAATAVGVGVSLMQLGVLALPPLFGLLIDETHNYKDSWLLLTVFIACGVLMACAVRERRRKGPAIPGAS